jgi:3-isopropylmalate/(R)-2-methylmalate dehydratase small subunit
VTIDARIVRIHGDDIDTDVLYPGPFLDIEDPELMKDHLFEGLDPALRGRLGGDTALVVDSNFGCGSSREHVPQAMKASGVKCVIARSFARIFYRNCINLGLPAVVCPEAVDAAHPDSTVVIDLAEGRLEVDGAAFAFPRLPPALQETVEAGGLIEAARRRAERAAG